jgi:hypothetical protein
MLSTRQCILLIFIIIIILIIYNTRVELFYSPQVYETATFEIKKGNLTQSVTNLTNSVNELKSDFLTSSGNTTNKLTQFNEMFDNLNLDIKKIDGTMVKDKYESICTKIINSISSYETANNAVIP